MVAGENSVGKPGKPYIVSVTLLGYFAPIKTVTASAVIEGPSEINSIKDVSEVHERIASDDIKGRGDIFVDHEETPIKLTLGDDRLPIGLWKSIEHMRKGEKSRIMIKPKHGYDCE